jgi:thioredoxin 1
MNKNYKGNSTMLYIRPSFHCHSRKQSEPGILLRKDSGQAGMTKHSRHFSALLRRSSLSTAAVLLLIVSLAGCSNAAGIDDLLDNAKKEGKVVMLELGSVGCTPCERMKPVMQKLSENYTGKLEVIFIDVREDRKTGRRFGVHMIPTQVFLDREGKEFHRHIGYFGYEEIVPVLKKAGL